MSECLLGIRPYCSLEDRKLFEGEEDSLDYLCSQALERKSILLLYELLFQTGLLVINTVNLPLTTIHYGVTPYKYGVECPPNELLSLLFPLWE